MRNTWKSAIDAILKRGSGGPKYSVSTEAMTPLGELERGENDPETRLDLRETEEAGRESRAFLAGMSWCEQVLDGYFDRGFSQFAVFYFRLRPRVESGADPEVWIIGGDCPPAFLDVESCRNGAEAAAAYVILIREWAEAAVAGQTVEGLFTVGYRGTGHPIEPTPELGELLLSRMAFIERNLLDDWRDEIREGLA